MDTKDALDKIKETEEKAQGIIEQAKKETHNILHEANQERARIIKRAQEEAILEAQKLKKEIAEEARKEGVLICNHSQDAIDELKTKAASRIDKAVDFIKTKL